MVGVSRHRRSDNCHRLVGRHTCKLFPEKISRVIFDKMQGGPTHCIAESHCAAESWKNFSLRKEQGGASRIAGKHRGTAGMRAGPDAGIADARSRNCGAMAQSLVRRDTELRQSSNGANAGAGRSGPARFARWDGARISGGALAGSRFEAIHKSGTRTWRAPTSFEFPTLSGLPA